MTKAVGFVSALIFALGAVPAARAQVMLDVSKITCDQFAGYKITTPQNIAIWLNGYYSGKRSNTVIDMQKLGENTKTLERYCIQNPQILVMNAVESIFGEKYEPRRQPRFCAAGDVRQRLEADQAVTRARARLPAASLGSDVCLFDDVSPFVHLGAEKGGKLIGRRADHHDADLLKVSSDRRLGQHCDRIVVNFPDDVLGRLGRNEERGP